MAKADTKNRARISILSELLAFPTINQKDWISAHTFDHYPPAVGDLVSLCSGPESKWYVSWVREIKSGVDLYSTNYLLESIDDGELCWWMNIGLNIYDRERVSKRVTWRWTDKQFALYDRWLKVCKRNNAYIIRPELPIFNDDGSVVLNVRTMHILGDFNNPETFPNWKKLTMKTMDEYYKKSEKLYAESKAVCTEKHYE